MNDAETVILDDESRPEPDYSPEALEAFRRRTEAGEDPVAVAMDLNRRRYEGVGD